MCHEWSRNCWPVRSTVVNGVRVAQYLVFSVLICRTLFLSFCLFFFWPLCWWYKENHISETMYATRKFENTKGVIRREAVNRKNRQHNRKKKKKKRTNNDQQNITQKIKDRATRTPLKKQGWTQVTRKFLLHMWHPIGEKVDTGFRY